MIRFKDEDFVETFSAFVEECCNADTHNNQEMIDKIHRAHEVFDLEDQETVNALIGGLILKMAYYRQEMDGTHDILSTHSDSDKET